MAITAFQNECVFIVVPRKPGSRPAAALFTFNMIPEDMRFSHKLTYANGYRAVVPLLVVEERNGEERLKKLGVLVLRGERLQVRRSQLAGMESVKKVAVFITGAARVLSQIVNARFDPLTGLPRAPEFRAQLGTMIRQLGRRQNFSLLAIDLDRFKQINDSYGHRVGDLVLRTFAQELNKSVRSESRVGGAEPVDLVFRTGGEEFAIILPDAGVETACQIAERIRERVESTKFRIPDEKTVRLTASIGVVDARTVMNGKSTRDMHVSESMVERGDRAMYLIKNGGRNGVAYIKREGRELEAVPYIPAD
uniref:GGDEF domain-containing protein n=1 Tax=Candidatus Methanophaga sp. ANME-1 ERB7 TaxID=2759913 RepID=A0A7G9Z2F7_9EURY|nr:hypothetical protein IPKNHHKO_00016 [Methanosarcinales archaeon ANME-1 ERB7]